MKTILHKNTYIYLSAKQCCIYIEDQHHLLQVISFLQYYVFDIISK